MLDSQNNLYAKYKSMLNGQQPVNHNAYGGTNPYLDTGRMPYPQPTAPRPPATSTAPPPAWRPMTPASATRPVDVSKALAGYLSGGNAGYGGGQGMSGPMIGLLGAGNYWHNWQTQNHGWNDNAGGPSGGYGSGGQAVQTADGRWIIPNGFGGTEVQGPTGSPLGSLVSEYQRAQNEAVQANEDRYKNILGGYDDRWQRTMARLNGVGDQQRRDLNLQYNAQGEGLKASLMDRGMSGTSVEDTMLAGNERDRGMQRNRLQDALNREYIGYDTGLQGDLLQFMERRQDTYPDLGQLTQLAQMLGVSTPSGGGGGMGGGMDFVPAGAMGFGPNPGAMMQGGGFGGNPWGAPPGGWNLAGGTGGMPSGLNPYQQAIWNHNNNGGRDMDQLNLAQKNAWLQDLYARFRYDWQQRI